MNLLTTACRVKRGFTLVEITLVISLILGLIAVLVLGGRSYNRGVDKARCILHLESVYKATMSYANYAELMPGELIPDDATLHDVLVGQGKMIEVLPTCPSQGEYNNPSSGELFDGSYLGWDSQRIPFTGVAPIVCPLRVTHGHVDR